MLSLRALLAVAYRHLRHAVIFAASVATDRFFFDYLPLMRSIFASA